MTDIADNPATPAPPLRRNREYLAWVIGGTALDLGAGIGMFAFPLVAFAVTGSLAATGMVGLVQGLGTLAAMIPGGLLADRYDRRRLRLLAAVTGMVMQALLIVVLLQGWGSLTVLATIAFVNAARGTLLGSASDPMLKQIVTPEQLPRAVSVNEGRGAAIEMAAGPTGGALLAVNIALPALAQLLGNLGSLLATFALRGDYRSSTADAPHRRVREELGEAWAWVRSQSIRLQLMACAMLVNLGSNGLLLAVTLNLADQGVPAARIGLLNTVLAASILLGALLAPWLVVRVPTGILTAAPLLLLAVLGAVIPLLPSMWWIAGAYAVMGLWLPALNASSQGCFMHLTPRAMMGRVGAFMGLGAMGMMPLAPAIAGWGLDLVGALPTMLVFAVITAAGALVVLLGRDLRQVPTSPRWQDFARERGLLADGTSESAPSEADALERT